MMLCLVACNNDTVVGSGLLGDEELGIEVIDDVVITAQTVEVDSTLIFTVGDIITQTFPLGRLEDNYFGLSRTEIIASTGVEGNGTLPDFDDVEMSDIDSCVLVLRLDTLGNYGDTLSTFDFEIFRLTESLNNIDSFISNVEYSRDMMPIGSLDGYSPDASDSLFIQESQDSVLRVGTIRIPIDVAFAEEIVAWVNQQVMDSVSINEETFTEAFNGLVIQATPSDGNAMVGIDLSPVAFSNDLSELAIYYSQDTLENRKYGFSVGNRKNLFIERDYSGSVVEEAIAGGTTFGDSLLFVESSGVNLEFDVSNVADIQDRLLNHAVLELIVADVMDNDLGFFPPIDLLIVSRTTDEGQLFLIEDIASLGLPASVEQFEDNGRTLYRYTLPLTRYLQDVINSVEIGDKLTISANLQAERPNRSIIFGPNHSTYPSKLRLTFTNP